MYKQIASEHIPTRKIWKREGKLPWINSKIKKEQNKRYHLLRLYKNNKDPGTWKLYKDTRSHVKKLLRKAEIQYWREQFAKADNSKKFWVVVRKAQGKDKKRAIPPLYGNDGDILTDDLDKAKCINEYFTNIGKHLAEKFNHSSDSATDRQLEHIYRVSPMLSNINLYSVLKNSIPRNMYPENWKTGKVTPAYKKGEKLDKENYRPLTMLNLNSKILESIICDSIDKHLSSAGILHLNQWGFKKGISTESLLLYPTETWKKAIDSGYKIGVIFVDFKKVFDTVDHQVLKYKLQALGIAGDLHEWIIDYLSDRKQYIEINGVRSSIRIVEIGVPKGHSWDRGYMQFTQMICQTPQYSDTFICSPTTQRYTILEKK